jgi:hypothetical protein
MERLRFGDCSVLLTREPKAFYSADGSTIGKAMDADD